MTIWFARRVGLMALTMLTVSLVLFLALEINGDSVAVKVLGQFSTEEQRRLWLEENGYFDPLHVRYGRWLTGFVVGDWGVSTRFKEAVAPLVMDRLGNTAILALTTLAVMVPISLVLGVLAGMREASLLDRSISILSVISTSIPEFASAVFLSALLVFGLGWLPGTSAMTGGFDPVQLILPVLVLALYSIGYLARMTRSSMAEVMSSHYVRTAIMKGVPFGRVVIRHALRNALVAPITVIMLQIPWLLSGVIVVEAFFAYKGFGSLLLEASLNDDIFLIEACAMVSVLVVVSTQLLSDLLYVVLNPRIDIAGQGATA